jgi:AhpD family alkylhydroperoxidase
MRRATVVLGVILLVQGVPVGTTAKTASSAAGAVASVDSLMTEARARVGAAARVPLAPADTSLPPDLRLGGPESPAYVRALNQLPGAITPMAQLVHTMLYDGALPMETKAAMGLRIAQVNRSPYVAAHTARLLRATGPGRTLLATLRTAARTAEPLDPATRVAIEYGEALTRSVHGVDDDAFARTRAIYDDAEVVELTLVTCFFNYFTRYAEALRLPVEAWTLETPGPTPAGPKARRGKARVALISDAEMTATADAIAASKDPARQRGGLGLGIANSQRAMLRAPALARAWRAYGTAVRANETVGRDIKLQVSFAVSVANECRYCTLHQVLGLRRLGVDPAKLVAMRKDDSALTPREAVAVKFARKLTNEPSGVTDQDYGALRGEFGDVGAQEVLLQTCGFAFMNRFTDGLLLPSEDEAIRIYQETYGASWESTSSR